MIWTNLARGFTALENAPSLAYLLGGSIIGMLFGVVPGIQTPVLLSIILIFVYHLNLTATLCLFLGTQAASYYAASVTSILLNTPAHPEAFAVTFDGYPMARRGEPGRALGISAASTCIGGLIGCVVFVILVQFLDVIPGVFHPPEYVALVTLAIIMVGTLGADSVGKALVATGAGLVLASIGPSLITGQNRYTFGALGLYSGVSLVGLALGVFAIPQMVMVFGTGTTVARQDMTGKEIEPTEGVPLVRGFGKQLLGGVFESLHYWKAQFQGGLVGSLTGLVPGIGGFTANFLAYEVAKLQSRRRDQFGTGVPEGIIAPEGASISKEIGSMIPILGLGIPGSVGGALFLAALAIKGVQPGYGFTQANPTVPYEIAWIIALAGIIGTAVGVFVGPQLAKITRVPGPFLLPFVFAFSILGPFLSDTMFFSVTEALVFGVVGLALRRLRYPLAAFILGLVLGPTFETNIYLTRNVYPGVSFLTARPLADIFFALAIGVLVMKALEIRRASRREKERLQDILASTTDPAYRAQLELQQERQRAPYPLLELTTTVLLLCISLFVIVWGIEYYQVLTWIMPVIGGSFMAASTAFLLPRHVRQYIRYRRSGGRHAAPLSSPATSLVGGGGGDVGAKELLRADSGSSTRTELVAAFTSSEAVEESFESPAPLPPFQHQAIADKSWANHGQYRRELIAFAYLFALVAACWLIGFLWGTTLFVVAYGLLSMRRFCATWIKTLLFTGLSAAAVWLIVFGIFSLAHLTYLPIINL
jgi:putative tricarboxylic transport membrane protein